MATGAKNNPPFDKTWLKEQVSGWLNGLNNDDYYFAKKFDGLSGEELYGYSDAQINDIAGDVKDESKKFLVAFRNKIHPQAQPQIAPGAGQEYSIKRFEELLRKSSINPNIINIRTLGYLSTRFHQQMRSAIELNDSDTANLLYTDVYNLPGTATKNIVNNQLGLSINGPWNQRSIGNLILIAVDLGVPKLLKKVSAHEIDIVNKINRQQLDVHIPLVPCQVVTTSVPNYDDGWTCVKMPTFISDVEMLPILSIPTLVEGGRRMAGALEILHTNNPTIYHIDVKPSNIFVDMDGRWYLGDFGSCVIGNHAIGSTTIKFLPKHFDIGRALASSQHDYFMLLAALAYLVTKSPPFIQYDGVDINGLENWMNSLEISDFKALLFNFKEKAASFFVKNE